MLFQNQTDGTVFLAIGPGGIRVAPKGKIEIPDGYSHPRRADNGSRRPSVVEELCGPEVGEQCKLLPADPSQRAQWLQAPPASGHNTKAVQMPTVDAYVAQGIPRAQAEILVRQAHQAIIDALTPKEKR